MRTAAVLFALALAGCGGGGNDFEPLRVTVASSTWRFPDVGALQDAVFQTGTFTNTGSDTLTVGVHSTATRELAAPGGTGGTLYLFVSVEDQTTQQLIKTDCHSVAPMSVEAGGKLTVSEDLECAVSIPAGHAVSFTPYARVASAGSSAFGFVLATTSYSLTVQ